MEPFRVGLNETGYGEGHNLAIESRWARKTIDIIDDKKEMVTETTSEARPQCDLSPAHFSRGETT